MVLPDAGRNIGRLRASVNRNRFAEIINSIHWEGMRAELDCQIGAASLQPGWETGSQRKNLVAFRKQLAQNCVPLLYLIRR